MRQLRTMDDSRLAREFFASIEYVAIHMLVAHLVDACVRMSYTNVMLW